MPTIFQTVDKDGQPHKRWRFKYVNYLGKRVTETGFASKAQTEKLAWQRESEHDAIRKGLRPPPKEADKRTFAETIVERIEFGKSQGGHGGRPWSEMHLYNSIHRLGFWEKNLKLNLLSELIGSLSAVERILRDLQKKGLSGKTLYDYAKTLTSFCKWCVKRDYLEADPLKNLVRFDTTPKTIRRAMTVLEVGMLLRVAPEYRRHVYLVALCSGLRRNELAQLIVADLNVETGCLRLHPEWTKNHKDGWQPLPAELVAALVAAAAGKLPTDPMLKVPDLETFYRDLDRAGIPRMTPEGKVDFHAQRVAYTTFVIESGASVKEAQALARHSSPDLTMNLYARARSARLGEVIDKLGQMILPSGKCPMGVQQAEVSVQQDRANVAAGKGSDNPEPTPPVGSPPTTAVPSAPAKIGQVEHGDGLEAAELGHAAKVTTAASVEKRTGDAAAGSNPGLGASPIEVQWIASRWQYLPGHIQQEISRLTTETPPHLACSGVFGFSASQPEVQANLGVSGFSGFSGCRGRSAA